MPSFPFGTYVYVFAEKDDKSAHGEIAYSLSRMCVLVRAHVSRSLHRGPRYNRACI